MATRRDILARARRPMPLSPLRPPVSVRGTESGDEYTDDHGNVWSYEMNAFTGNTRASTTAYGGSTTEWRTDRSQVNTDIDRRADLLYSVTKAASDAEKAASESTDSSTSTPTKKPGSVSVTDPVSKAASKAISNATATISNPKAPASPWTFIAILGPPIAGGFLAGPLGVGIGLAVGAGAYLVSRKAA